METPDKGVWVKVIAGESMGTKAVIETRTPILFLHFKLQPGSSFTQVGSRSCISEAFIGWWKSPKRAGYGPLLSRCEASL